MFIYDVMYVIMTLCDVVGRLFRGFRKKGAVRLGLFLLWPPDSSAVCYPLQ